MRSNGSQYPGPKALAVVRDCDAGFTRVRRGKSFQYVDENGRGITDQQILARIRKLAIPPAYSEVWICRDSLGHIQATGRDARGRKQYRYHADWRQARDEAKFRRLLDFAHALPRLRAQVQRDCSARGLTRRKVLASLTRLLEITCIRVGNEQYRRENGSFGLTTLQDRHVILRGGKTLFQFQGKSGKKWRLWLADARLARIVESCRSVPGTRLFQYYDADGQRRRIRPQDLNDYIREAAGGDFSTKDFRTWTGSVFAFESFVEARQKGLPATKSNVNAVIAGVAARLGNTVAVCRKSYIHPAVISHFAAAEPDEPVQPLRIRGLSSAERGVAALIAARFKKKRSDPRESRVRHRSGRLRGTASAGARN